MSVAVIIVVDTRYEISISDRICPEAGGNSPACRTIDQRRILAGCRCQPARNETQEIFSRACRTSTFFAESEK